MILVRVVDEGLSQYSYLVGCPGTGEAAVVDPRRDVDTYTALARDQGLRIAHVLETHIHADFASGARELGEVTGASLHLSAYDDGEVYDVAFPHQPMGEGDTLAFGDVVIEAVHTPGHTPEHLSFLVYEKSRAADTPALMLSGDFLFVGSLGRPDLLGEEAKVGLARRLYSSVATKLQGLPDGLEVHPGHGAGSMCGAGLGGRATSTLGFERLANPYLAPQTEDDFVARILESTPPFPPYYRRMKALNAAGPPVLGRLPGANPLAPERVRALAAEDHVVVDLREALHFGAGHIPGALNVGANGDFSMWAAWVVPYDTPLILVANDVAEATGAIRGLVRVGLDDVVGYLDGGMASWIGAGFDVRRTPLLTPPELRARLAAGEDLRVVDVRTQDEYAAGHIAGAVNVPGGDLAMEPGDLAHGPVPLAVVCETGYRSSVAASVLARHGLTDVINVIGGMTAWRRGGLPIVA